MMACGTGSIGTILTEEDPVMDLISFPLHPVEETFQTDETPFSVEKNLLLFGLKFIKRFLSWNSKSMAGFPEIIVKVYIGRGVPRGKWLFIEGFFGIRNHLLPIDSNDPSKTL